MKIVDKILMWAIKKRYPTKELVEKQTATMEIVHSHVYPQTFELSSALDLRVGDEEGYVEFVRKSLAARVGEKLLESEMFEERYSNDYYMMQKRIVFRLRVLPPERR